MLKDCFALGSIYFSIVEGDFVSKWLPPFTVHTQGGRSPQIYTVRQCKVKTHTEDALQYIFDENKEKIVILGYGIVLRRSPQGSLSRP